MRESWRQGEVAARMRLAVSSLQVSQAEVARRMGVRAATVSRWLSGQRAPSEEDMQRFADAVFLSAEYLWTGREAAEPAQAAAVTVRSSRRSLPTPGEMALLPGPELAELAARLAAELRRRLT